jgi:hypothetical protein
MSAGGGESMRIANKVVVHFRDGKIVKGYTYDFSPNKDIFHVVDANDKDRVTEISTSQLKALFFVKTFEGNKNHPDPGDFSMEQFKNSPGLKVKVTFFDHEVMYGSTHGYAPNRKGFFISPANKEINNDRVFVVKDSTVVVETWQWERSHRPSEDRRQPSSLTAPPPLPQ